MWAVTPPPHRRVCPALPSTGQVPGSSVTLRELQSSQTSLLSPVFLFSLDVFFSKQILANKYKMHSTRARSPPHPETQGHTRRLQGPRCAEHHLSRDFHAPQIFAKNNFLRTEFLQAHFQVKKKEMGKKKKKPHHIFVVGFAVKVF